MKASTLFMKTLPFCWAKLILGVANLLAAALLFGILFGVGMLIGEESLFIMFLIWVVLAVYVNYFINHYFGYLVKAGHVAVITEAVTGGALPENQVKYGASKVKERFVTANVYFVVDKLVSRAVKQIQNGVEKVGNLFDSIPGVSTIASLLNMFIGIFLGYIDECCLGWTFHNKEQSAFKSAADAVVIYAQSWKTLMKSAAFTMIKVIVAMIVLTIVCFVPVALLFSALEWNLLIGFVLSIMLANAVKSAFLDSFIMCEMITSYMNVATQTEITFDLYGKLCKISNSFKKLFDKGQAEPSPVPAAAATNTGV